MNDDGGTGLSAELRIGFCLLASIGATIGLGIVYVLGGQVQLEGILLGVSLGGIALALGLWAKYFMPHDIRSEPRPVLASTDQDRRAVAEQFDEGERSLTRRRVLTGLLVSAAGALGALALFPIRSLGPSPLPELRRTAWSRGKRLVDEDGRPVQVDDLEVDGVLTVFPEGTDAPAETQTVLIRLQPGEQRDTRSSTSVGPEGYVAYSKVCTHAGCPVGLYEAETHQLVCPCHQSLFDVTDGARPVFGPASRALPRLPLSVDDLGYLMATDDFDKPVGPGFWNYGG